MACATASESDVHAASPSHQRNPAHRFIPLRLDLFMPAWRPRPRHKNERNPRPNFCSASLQIVPSHLRRALPATKNQRNPALTLMPIRSDMFIASGGLTPRHQAQNEPKRPTFDRRCSQSGTHCRSGSRGETNPAPNWETHGEPSDFGDFGWRDDEGGPADTRFSAL
jgi:hypothetical protein